MNLTGEKIVTGLVNFWESFLKLWDNDVFTTVFCTVIAGVILFVISERLKNFWLTPLDNYKKL